MFLRHLAKFLLVLHWRLHKQIKRSVRLRTGKSILRQRAIDQISVFLISLQIHRNVMLNAVLDHLLNQ